jgi:hypothetical protein
VKNRKGDVRPNFLGESSTRTVDSVGFSPSPETKALPLEWFLAPKNGTLAERILARLIQSEAHEASPHFRDDYRQSFIALTLALEGSPIPFIEASYRMYGLHPDKVWPAMVARRAALIGRPAQFPSSDKKQSEPSEFVRLGRVRRA